MNNWKDWIAFHGNLFGLLGDSDTGMMASWTRIFHKAGITPQQATSASEWLASNEPPQWRTAHLAAMQGRLKAMREEAEKIEREAAAWKRRREEDRRQQEKEAARVEAQAYLDSHERLDAGDLARLEDAVFWQVAGMACGVLRSHGPVSSSDPPNTVAIKNELRRRHPGRK